MGVQYLRATSLVPLLFKLEELVFEKVAPMVLADLKCNHTLFLLFSSLFSAHTPLFSPSQYKTTWEGPWWIPEECVCLREEQYCY